jgi:hypothetical protein
MALVVVQVVQQRLLVLLLLVATVVAVVLSLAVKHQALVVLVEETVETRLITTAVHKQMQALHTLTSQMEPLAEVVVVETKETE